LAKRKLSQTNYLLQLIALTLLLLAIPLTIYALGSFRLPFGAAKKGGEPGHGAPSGPHYNLNIIGVPKQKQAEMTGGSGHRIFVPLTGKTKINLTEGDTFQVIDGNATDGKGEFMLPNPDPDNDGVTEYSVWARALGKPGGKSETATCAYDVYGEEWCSVYTMILVREKGQSKFSNVTKQLLYIYVDLDADGTLERYPLFDPALLEYFWSYDNKGLKLAQLRFYEIVTEVE